MDNLFPQVENLIFVAHRGSKIHNMNTEDSDDDYIAAYIHSLESYFSLTTPKDVYSISEHPIDAVAYEFKKLVGLLAKGNPNVLEILWTDPKYFFVMTAPYDTLRANRKLFLSKEVYNTFCAYAKNQMTRAVSLTTDKLEKFEFLENLLIEHGVNIQELSPNQKLRDTVILNGKTLDFYLKEFIELKKKYFNGNGRLGARRRELIKRISFDSKNVSVLIMLLKQAITLLNEGYLEVERNDRDELMSIKNGEWTLEEVKEYTNSLFFCADVAKNNSKLPETVDFEAINTLTVSILKDFYQTC